MSKKTYSVFGGGMKNGTKIENAYTENGCGSFGDDTRFVKTVRFQTFHHVSYIIKGIETISVIYKQKRSHIPDFFFSTYKELQ